MKLILDNIIFSLQKSGGISVYWYEIINNILKKSEKNYKFIEEVNSEKNIFRTDLDVEKINVYTKNIYSKKYFSRYREIDLKITNSAFIFHSSYYRTLSEKVKRNNSVKEVVTVHDFTYEHFSSGLKKWLHSSQKKKAIKAADTVICISQNTKQDLIHFFPEFSQKKIVVIYNGVSKDYFEIMELKEEQNESPYFIFVGSRAKYKNFDFAVKAVSQLDEKYKLTIIGAALNKEELFILNDLLPGRWKLLVNVENKELNEVYNKAYALLYPSSYEGFGIPLIEAMRAGCPYIALNASSISEVSNTAGVLIEKLEISHFNEAVLNINKNRQEIIKKGYNRANDFSWEKCYEETMNVYKDLYK